MTAPSEVAAGPAAGTCQFGPLSIGFDHRVLEPRQWTVAQSEWAAQLDATLPPGPLLELCTGAGHIGLLAAHLTRRPAVLVDLDRTAADWAQLNAAAAGVVADVRCGPMEAVLDPDERFPLILADPPWVPTTDTGQFPEDPLFAIDGGSDGLAIARKCIRVIAEHLAENGAAIIQLGSTEQAQELGEEARGQGLLPASDRAYDRGVLMVLHRASSTL